MFSCRSGNIHCFKKHIFESGEGGEMCGFAVVPDIPNSLFSPLLRASVWLSVYVPGGPGSRSKEQGREYSDPPILPGVTLYLLLFPEDKQALGMGVDISGQPLCSQYSC